MLHWFPVVLLIKYFPPPPFKIQPFYGTSCARPCFVAQISWVVCPHQSKVNPLFGDSVIKYEGGELFRKQGCYHPYVMKTLKNCITLQMIKHIWSHLVLSGFPPAKYRQLHLRLQCFLPAPAPVKKETVVLAWQRSLYVHI